MDINLIKSFLDDNGRLISYPAKYSKKLVVHEYLSEKFEKGKEYTEKEVNKIILDWILFDDYATLRRALIDYGYMERSNSIYKKKDD